MDRSTEEAQTKEMDIRSLSSSHHHSQSERYIHKVGVPPKQNLFKEFRETLKETFFADDPLRPFKDRSRSQKFILGIQTIFPIFEWGRKYNLKKLRGDLIAGLTIASLCIPQDIGYAKLANLDPQYGLYSSFVPPLIYAFMGSSRDIAIGPVAVVSLLLGTMLQNELDPINEKAQYQRLAFTATFFAGITQVTLGFFRYSGTYFSEKWRRCCCTAYPGKSRPSGNGQASRLEIYKLDRRGQYLPHSCRCSVILRPKTS